MSLEDSLKSWAKPPGETEQTKCDNAVNAVKKAVAANTTLAKHNIRIFAQGSYANRTNVREDSDVDVCALCTDTFFYDLPQETTVFDFGLTNPAAYLYSQFKNDVQAALNSYFTKWGTVFSGKTPSQEKDPRGRVAIRHPFMALDQRLKETRDYVDAIIHSRLMH